MSLTRGCAVGIDLGTTYSAIAAVGSTGKAHIVPDSASNRLTPSVLLFDEDGDVIVGRVAKQNAAIQPTRVVEFVKREMGRTREEFSRTFRGESYDASQLSGLILRKLKEEAEFTLGQPVVRAVITVPAYFTDPQRFATQRAGEFAGLHVLRLIDEPVAAAIAFGVDRKSPDCRIMVFDLGGGTLDVSVLQKTGNELVVLATDGDHRLGGKDWDDALMHYAANAFQTQFSISPLDDPASYQELQLRCIQVKETLSQISQCSLVVQRSGHSLPLDITRDTFNKLTSHLVNRCEFICNNALNEAKSTWREIDLILLVGGSTRMPAVRQMIASISGREGSGLVHPDEAVALGAAYAACIFEAESRMLPGGRGMLPDGTWELPADPVPPPPAVRVSECLAHSLGTIVKDGPSPQSPDILSIVMRRGQRIGKPYRGDYATLFDGQTAVRFRIVEGETLESATTLGECVLTDLPSGRAQGRPLWLELQYDCSHILTATACDVETGKMLQVQIHRPQDLDTDDQQLAESAVRRIVVR